MSDKDIFHRIIDMAESIQPKIQIFSIDHAHDDERREITDLYWADYVGLCSLPGDSQS